MPASQAASCSTKQPASAERSAAPVAVAGALAFSSWIILSFFLFTFLKSLSPRTCEDRTWPNMAKILSRKDFPLKCPGLRT
jgi:hypothetical protein